LAPVLEGSVPAALAGLTEACLLAAIASDLLGETEEAEANVERALELAEPQGLMFPFVVSPANDLLARHPRHRTAHGALLEEILDGLAGKEPAVPAAQPTALREDLTECELRVLRYLPTNLSAREIGQELYLSVHTVKTHMWHLYAKLDVHRRT